MAVMDWLTAHPGEISGAVLVNTSFRELVPASRRLLPATWWPILRAVLETDIDERERSILSLTSQKKDWSDDVIATRSMVQRLRPVTRANFFRQLVAAGTFRLPATRPTVPILLLNSLGDRLVHPDCSRKLAEKWKLPLETHPWAGHDLPLDDPEWMASRVAVWLEKPSSRQALAAE